MFHRAFSSTNSPVAKLLHPIAPLHHRCYHLHRLSPSATAPCCHLQHRHHHLLPLISITIISMGIQEYLDTQNISSSDVAPFVIIHTVLSAILVGSTWWLCYSAASLTSLQPAAKSLGIDEMPRSALLNSLVATPFISDGIKRRACGSLVALEKASKNSKLVAFLDRKFPSLDATRLCVSYAEAKLGRLFFKPLTIPGRIWLSWTGTKAWQQLKTNAKKLDTTLENNHLPSVMRNNNHLSSKSTFIDQRSNRIFTRQHKYHPPKVGSVNTKIINSGPKLF